MSSTGTVEDSGCDQNTEEGTRAVVQYVGCFCLACSQLEFDPWHSIYSLKPARIPECRVRKKP